MGTEIRWAPRVPMEWLKRLYEQDAMHITDEELIDKVGYRLYERCRDCMLVVDSVRGVYACPGCRLSCALSGDLLSCSSCGWTSPLDEFRRSWRHKELNADTTFMEQFVVEWDRARSPKQRMLAIDGVIHRWHHETKNKGLGRPVGLNLIEGSRRQVIAFLDGLSSGENHDRWEAHHENVKAGVRRWHER